ncbi:MAG: hypothetical protein AVDCRST_MAG12-1618, partial [uncultured Rubrobacteraceae bacterium]
GPGQALWGIFYRLGRGLRLLEQAYRLLTAPPLRRQALRGGRAAPRQGPGRDACLGLPSGRHKARLRRAPAGRGRWGALVGRLRGCGLRRRARDGLLRRASPAPARAQGGALAGRGGGRPPDGAGPVVCGPPRRPPRHGPSRLPRLPADL